MLLFRKKKGGVELKIPSFLLYKSNNQVYLQRKIRFLENSLEKNCVGGSNKCGHNCLNF
jgi:hypothetical protein